jgi:hypothetical protein
LLTVASDVGQERRIWRVARQQLAHTPGLIMWATTASLLAAQGPLAPIWFQVVPQEERLAVASRSPPATRTTFLARGRAERGEASGQAARGV